MLVFAFAPMEILDIWLCHFGGNKYRTRETGDLELYEHILYEHIVGPHWLFLRITTPLVIVLVPFMIHLAIVKPF